MILVDSNVIIDVISTDATWSARSESALINAADRDEIAINPIIHAEIASGFATMAALDGHLGVGAFCRLPRGRRRAYPPDPRRQTLCRLFPQGPADRAALTKSRSIGGAASRRPKEREKRSVQALLLGLTGRAGRGQGPSDPYSVTSSSRASGRVKLNFAPPPGLSSAQIIP